MSILVSSAPVVHYDGHAVDGITFSDYREIDGIKLPFKTVNNNPGNGDIVSITRSVKHNVAVDDKVFAPRKLK